MRLTFVKRGRRPPLLPTRFKYPYPSLSHPTSTADSDRATARSLFRVFRCPMISDLFCGVRVLQSGQPQGLSLRCGRTDSCKCVGAGSGLRWRPLHTEVCRSATEPAGETFRARPSNLANLRKLSGVYNLVGGDDSAPRARLDFA